MSKKLYPKSCVLPKEMVGTFYGYRPPNLAWVQKTSRKDKAIALTKQWKFFNALSCNELCKNFAEEKLQSFFFPGENSKRKSSGEGRVKDERDKQQQWWQGWLYKK